MLPSPALIPAASHGNGNGNGNECPYMNLVTLWMCPCASSQHWAHPAAPSQHLHIAASPPGPHLHWLASTLPHKVMSTVLSPSLAFIFVHTRWPSLGICFFICLCSDHRQIEEDMTNINLQLLIWAIPTRFCMAAVAEGGGSDVLFVTFLKSPLRGETEPWAICREYGEGNRRGLLPRQSFC